MKHILCFCFLTFFTVIINAGSLVLYDGGEHNTGKGFALPRGISKWKISYKRPYTNKNHISFSLKPSGSWTGCGWNWASWKGEGTDISNYRNITFYIALSPFKISDMTFQLISKSSGGEADGMGKKVSIFPFITKRGKYIKITVPIKDLLADTLNEKTVWGFNIGISTKSSSARKCRIFIDQIELTE